MVLCGRPLTRPQNEADLGAERQKNLTSLGLFLSPLLQYPFDKVGLLSVHCRF